ncbi:hypothetical protein WG29040_23540 [Pseudomonas sp. PAMC 29040]|uniref:defense against restriction DarA-related protein n=1 Tax=Pseudomonas sp. PAMC 29040 TaxID=2498450 RepID=UPI000FB205CB|nr:hypothetical protein [Pseudomonas sp. PAMC 29040]RUT30914.1 hypothetical protein WG29040_23540 [Pseudomonas sp. PAMC 29040]
MSDVFIKLQSAAHAGAYGAGSRAEPTPAQIRAGNYAKGSFSMYGLRITIETPMFQPRRGKQDGKPWSITCMAHYGYVNGTKGADGDAVDVFVGPAPESRNVYVINQNAKGGAFDEHKVMLGFIDQDQARTAYLNSYEKGWAGLGSVAACTINQFKHWLKHGDLSQPLSPDLPNIPKDEALSMTDVFARWGADNLPVGQTVGALLYELRRADIDGLMFDSATMGDITQYLGDSGEMLDAMVIEYKQFERKAGQLLKVMQNSGGEVLPVGVEVSKPFKSKGTTQVAMLFGMSDGQSISVFFHNPDSTPNKLTPADELISWKWVQNKKDITAVVAPESGQDINPRIVARRIMALIQKNSAKFIKANEGKAARTAALDEQKALVKAKTGELTNLEAQILDLTARLEQKKAAPVAPVAAPVPVSVSSIILDDYADVAALGMATVLSVGSENVYFDKDGKQYMTKLLNTDDYEARVGEVVDLSGVVDPSAAPDVDESPAILQGPAGPVTVAKTKYVTTGEWGVSWASTHLATAASKAEGVAIAERVIASGADNIADMRAAAEPEVVPELKTETLNEVARRLVPEEFVSDIDPDGFTAIAADGYGIRLRPTAGGRMLSAYILKPGVSGQESMGSSTLENGIESAVGVALSTALTFIEKWRAEKAPGAGSEPVGEPAAEEDAGIIEAEGRENTVKTAKGTKVVTGFKVIEASKLIISHETDGTVNPEYPPEIQPRDRARTTSQAWVQKTARNLDPDSLGRTQRADSGAPIVGADRVVESGNGRAMAIREAYRIGQADEYREWLLENAEYFSVDPAKINRMKAPVLIRVRKTDVNRVEFAVESNQDDKLAMTATEKARSDAKRLDSAMLAKLADGDLNSAANRDFVAAFLQSLGDAEAAQYLTTDGKPTSGLISRLQAALFAGAYADDRLLEMTADQAKPEIANIVSALNSAAPDFMRAKEQDRIGGEQVGEQVTDAVELSLNQEAVNAIIGATNVLRQAKEAGMGLDEFLRQGDMFGGTDPAVAAMALFISANNRSAKRMGTAFKAMAQFVESENVRKQTAGLFGDEPASFTDIVSAANRKLEQEFGEGVFAIDQTDMFSPQPAAVSEPRQEAPSEEDALQEAKSYLDNIIGGTTDLGRPNDVLKELERIYAAYGEDQLSGLFVDASNAFRDYALKATAGAF